MNTLCPRSASIPEAADSTKSSTTAVHEVYDTQMLACSAVLVDLQSSAAHTPGEH
jgi:hypothetical protein